jgi:hypothetical protein
VVRAARGVVDGGDAWVASMRVWSLCGGAAEAPALGTFRGCHRRRARCWLGEVNDVPFKLVGAQCKMVSPSRSPNGSILFLF